MGAVLALATSAVVAAAAANPEDAVFYPGRALYDSAGERVYAGGANLFLEDVLPVIEELTQSLFDHIPVGVGSKGIIPTTGSDLEAALEMGMDWSLREGYAWAEDKEHCGEWFAAARALGVAHRPSMVVRCARWTDWDSFSLLPPLFPPSPCRRIRAYAQC